MSGIETIASQIMTTRTYKEVLHILSLPEEYRERLDKAEHRLAEMRLSMYGVTGQRYGSDKVTTSHSYTSEDRICKVLDMERKVEQLQEDYVTVCTTLLTRLSRDLTPELSKTAELLYIYGYGVRKTSDFLKISERQIYRRKPQIVSGLIFGSDTQDT